jgi:hypothetical protein
MKTEAATARRLSRIEMRLPITLSIDPLPGEVEYATGRG